MSEYNYSIDASSVNKIYSKGKSKINALTNFDLKIPKGSIYGLLGPNGAGKSTFINILGGLVKKDSGDINICGVNIDKNAKKSRQKIGIVPQELNIDPFFTPIELLELQAGLYGVSKKDRNSEEILLNMGLLEQRNAYARTLSGGMRRRLLVAKALVHKPEIIILDEPTAGVDVNSRASLWKYIKSLNTKGTTICLTTHYLEEAESLCNFITIINKGKIIKTDSKKNLLNIITKKRVTFILDKKYFLPPSLNKFDANLEENFLSLQYDKKKTQLKEIINLLNESGITFNEINTYENDREDIFLNLINNDKK